MIRAKKSIKLLFILTLFIFAFCFVQSAQAGIPPFMEDENLNYDQRLNFWMDSAINGSLESWDKVGAACNPEELEKGWWPSNPYQFRFYIDGQEIQFRRFFYKLKDIEYSVPYMEGGKWNYSAEPIITTQKTWFWYNFFAPGYFTPGTHTIRVEFWVYNSYGGSPETGWRIFVNYIGPPEIYRDVGQEMVWESTFTVFE